ncbi:recombination regulator RecX [Acaricomes phytoseiuli]|uniref:regulatory protein RecX n=1 Tax=Acaricomes phytoseiuli TaxID=291968 RepID=UPI00037623A9|nr:regulatory protein RecX [Acaricomes phytoseiuli]MCW1248813.1 recombination regulator RecX [Acaricomes phytoseiuli]
MGQQEANSEQDPESAARAILLRQLTDGPKTRAQLERNLAAKKIPEAVAEKVLDRFEEVQLVDDAQFARDWVRSRAQHRGLARHALRRELMQKGVPEQDAEAALAEVDGAAERERGVLLVQRKLRPGIDWADTAEREKQLRRLTSMLVRKGYNPGSAFGIVQEVLQEQQNADA